MAQPMRGPIDPAALLGRLAGQLASESLAWSILNWLPDAAVVVFDPELTVLAAAGEALARRGFDRDRVVGGRLPDLLPTMTGGRYVEHCRQALAGASSTLERETPDGEIVYRTEFAPLRSADGSVIAGIATSRDVTEARRAQAALVATAAGDEELRGQWQQTFHRTTRGICVADAATMVVRSVNPAFARMHGGTESDFVGQPTSRFLSETTRARVPEMYARIDREDFVRTESEHLRLDGSTIPVRAEMLTTRDKEGRPLYRIGWFDDLTEQRAIEAARRQADELFETAFADAPIGMAIVATDGSFIRVNAALCDLVGYSEQELSDRDFQAITHPDDLDADMDHVRQLLDGRDDRYALEKRYITAQGRSIWVNLSVSIVRDEAGKPLHFISQLQDISERKRLQESLQHLADHDPLTELWNRRRFEEELRRQLDRCHRYKERAALLILDLNGFKPINDTYGHKAGDQLLQAVADTLRQRLRITDCIARLGGDEFAIILTNVSFEQATRVAAQVKSQIAKTSVRAGDDEVLVTASVGLAHIDEETTDAGEVLHRADLAMYQAKPEPASSLPRDLAVPEPA